MNEQPRRGPRRHLSYANVIATLALFLALGGGSFALASHLAVRSSDIVNGEVKTPDLATNGVTTGKIRNGEVRNPDLIANGVTSGKIRNGEVRRADLATSAVDSAKVADESLNGGDIADRSLSGTEVAFGSLGGPEINESSLGQVPSALLGGFGRSGATTTCNPESGEYAFCAGTEILNVPPGARALVFGRALAKTDSGNDQSRGNCRLSTSSIGAIPNTRRFISAWPGPFESGTLVGVTPPLPAGPTSFGVECNEDSSYFSGQSYDEISASVVLISDN